MQTVVPFLMGVLIGVAVTWWLLSLAHKRSLRTVHADGQYEPARRAVARHFRLHGTLNLAQCERMFDCGDTTAARYLEHMVHDGLLKQHGHGGADTFYTLA